MCDFKGPKAKIVKLVRRTGGFDVSTEQPYKLIRLVIGGVKNMFVVIAGLNVLSMLKFSSKFVVDVVETLSKVVGSRNSVAFGDTRLKGRVIGVVGEEGCLFGRRVFGVVESELCDG